MRRSDDWPGNQCVPTEAERYDAINHRLRWERCFARGDGAVSPDDNKAAVRRFFNALNEDRLAELEADVLAPNYRLSFDGHPPLERAGAIAFFAAFLAAFPGIHHTIEDQFAADDRVATRIVVRGQHQADFMGMPPTGKEIMIGAINIHRFDGDKIAEQWVNSDALGLMQQLGAIPMPGDAASH